MRRNVLPLALLVLVFLASQPLRAGAESQPLQQGVKQYKAENYEESVVLLQEAVQLEPDSSVAAFFLGLAYKQMMEFESARKHLRAAVTLTPKIKEAAVELVEVLYHLPGEENLKEAEKWLAIAEQAEIYPARIAFLKGLILQKKGDFSGAIKAFEQAREKDSALSQATEIQIALCYLQEKRLDLARQRFQAAVLFDPKSDMASFARQYQEMVEKRIELEKPLHFTAGLFGQYDSNLLLKPSVDAYAPDVKDEDSLGASASFRVDYVPRLEGAWLFNAQYAFAGIFNKNHSTTHDVVSNTVSMAPGYNFGTYAVNLAASYSHSLLKSPGLGEYMGTLSVGPMFRTILKQDHILELYAGVSDKEYFQPTLATDEDRNSDGFNTYASWVWLYRKGAFLNLKYEFLSEDTVGRNWRNLGHRFSVNSSQPLTEKLRLQLNAQAYVQDYREVHTAFGVKREDRIYTLGAGVTRQLTEELDFVAQYSHSIAGSNIGVYDYDKDLVNAGLEYRF